MISSNQLLTFGKTLWVFAQAATLERRTLRALPVPLMFQFSELYYFEKWKHPQLLVEARRAAVKTPSLQRMWLLSAVLALITSYILTLPLFDANGLTIWAASTILLLPAYLHRRELMRRYIWQKT